MPFNFDNKSILITIVVIISGILFMWMVYPSINRNSYSKIVPEVEMFNPEEEHLMTAEESQRDMKPVADPRTASLMDGPGFERGDVDGVESITSTSIPANYYMLDDGAGGEFNLANNMCSKSCCSSQYPTPFKQKYDPYVCANKDQFVPSNMMCNNSFNDSGCMCLTKKQASFIYNRGISSGGREWW
jgi:hypothetical protein